MPLVKKAVRMAVPIPIQMKESVRDVLTIRLDTALSLGRWKIWRFWRTMHVML